MQLSYTGELVQTTYLYKKKEHVEGNLKATEDLITTLGPSRKPRSQARSDHRMWEDLPASTVTTYLRRFAVHPRSFNADTSRLSDYIERQLRHGELTSWTVILLSNRQGTTGTFQRIGKEEDIGLYLRDPRRNEQGEEEEPALYALRKSNIINPPDQGLDFDDHVMDEALIKRILAKRAFGGPHRQPDRDLIQASSGRLVRDVALDLSVTRWKRKEIRGDNEPNTPNGRVIRELRPETRGLMLLYPLTWYDANQIRFANVECDKPFVGFALSFPVSDRAQPIEYLVNEVYQRLHLGDTEDADD